jgi:Protein of unknown function (DUF3575)
MRHTLSAALFALLVPAAAVAQTAERGPAAVHDQVLSTNPLGVVVKWFNVEYERKLSSEVTFGGSASHFGELDQSNAAVLLRWYPADSALEGLYLGVRAGVYRFESYSYNLRSLSRQTSVMPGAGVEIGFNWLLGPRQNIIAGTGLGLTRLSGSNDPYSTAPTVLPAVRLNVGIAF